MDKFLKHRPSAKVTFSYKQKIIIVLVLTSLIVALIYSLQPTLLVLLLVVNLLSITLYLFKFLLYTAVITTTHTDTVNIKMQDEDLPCYTILIPLFHEAAILHQTLQAIRALDYPKSKLDVKLIIEEMDYEMRLALSGLQLESFFEVVIVPIGLPQTKPRALNYAMKFASGEYVTIYDAEDIADPQQLRLSLAAFAKAPERMVALQARLAFYNSDSNLLTKLLAIEYHWWFEFQLPGLERLHLPLVLGGSSNHFKRKPLEELQLWDEYNVTEDADLAMYLASAGYKAQMLSSITLEEAPSSVTAWILQRSRWIKGHMQTYLVHSRKLTGCKNLMALHLLLGLPCLSMLLEPIVWVFAIILLLNPSYLNYEFSQMFQLLIQTNLGLWFCAPFSFSLRLVIKNKWWKMLYLPLASPFYLLLHLVASYLALWQLIFKPFYWEKTKHGD
jgi:cellulose synthase/poly-beta-1,6-N-acetylglucosamine synthase-like glycosyltransferase